MEMTRHDSFNIFLIKAIMIHVSLLVFCFSIDYLFNLNLFDSKQIQKDLSIVESAVRIDVVGLPKFTLEELKQMNISKPVEEVVEEVKIEKNNETSKVEFVKKEKKINLNNILSNISKKKIRKPKKKKKETKKIDSTQLKKLVLEGNLVSKGSSATGNQTDLAAQKYISYIQSLPDRVKPHWKLPTYLLDKELQARIRVFIAANGALLKVQVYQSSGVNEFDEKALEAVKKSSPFPKPDGEILTKVIAGDVILGFPL